MTTDQLTTIEKIRMALDELQEIHGIQYLTYEICRNHDVAWVRSKLNVLEEQGLCQIVSRGPGRGRKTIIRKNRNSPGSPRREKGGRQIP